jgi:hypothetical protein
LKVNRSARFIFLLLTLAFGSFCLSAQEWQLDQEKDGIRIYTMRDTASSFKAYKGETEIRAEINEVSAIIEDVELFSKCDDDVDEIRMLDQKKGRWLKYYVVYNLPWPFQNRDLCVESMIADDTATRTRTITSSSIPEAVPPRENTVRIVNYWQRWSLQKKDNGLIHVVLEGFADPAGGIPAWIANLAITDTPMNILKSVRERFVR